MRKKEVMVMGILWEWSLRGLFLSEWITFGPRMVGRGLVGFCPPSNKNADGHRQSCQNVSL